MSDNDKLTTKTIAIRFFLGLIGGLGSLAASFLLYRVFTSPEEQDTKPSQTIIIQQAPKSRDPKGRWPEDINPHCRTFLESCYTNCKKEPPTPGTSEIKDTMTCRRICWQRRLEIEDARLLCGVKPKPRSGVPLPSLPR